jgi:hypothetical protein
MGISQQIGASSLIKAGVCTSSTRPASPYEGQMIYTTDLDTLEIWNGSAWRMVGAATPTYGTVLQIAVATPSTIITPVSSATYVDSGLTATITPKSATSKILIISNQSLYADTSTAEMGYALIRNSTTLDAQKAVAFSNSGAVVGQGVYNYLDAPNTTSAITYKTMIAKLTGSGTVYSNINNNAGRMTLMEIAG